MSRLALRLYLGCSSIFVLAVSGTARADDKAACVAAYEEAQTLRTKTELRSAHEQLMVCASQKCPKSVAEQCAGWLDEVEKATPTVNFAVSDEQGHDLIDVRVSFDGKVLKERLDGKGVAVDPGPHVFKFESGDRKPIEQSVVVREGEKNRQIVAKWSAAPSSGGGAPPPLVPVHDDGSKKSGFKPSPAFWALGAVGVAGFAAFGVFGGLGLSQKSKDAGASGCAPTCTDSEVKSIRTKFIAADVSLTVGALSLAGAGVFAILAATSKGSKDAATTSAPVSFSVGPAPSGGAYMSAFGRF